MLFVFISNFIYSNSAKIIFNEYVILIGPHLKIIRNCYYATAKGKEKETQKHLSHNF